MPSSVWKRTAAAPSASTANPRRTCSILRSRSTRHGSPTPLPCTTAAYHWWTAPCATPTLRPLPPHAKLVLSSALTRTCAFPSGRTATCCAGPCCSSCRFPTSSKFRTKSWNFSPALRTLNPPCRSCLWAMCSWSRAVRGESYLPPCPILSTPRRAGAFLRWAARWRRLPPFSLHGCGWEPWPSLRSGA